VTGSTIAVSSAPAGLRDLWVGLDVEVPVVSGGRLPYVNLDNTASTPAFRVVRDRVDAFLEWYASVHRGAGFKSRVSTEAYEVSREIVRAFVGADADRDRVVFTKHTTEAINLLAAAIGPSDTDRIAVSVMEHHSNMLPWRRLGAVDYIETDADGRLRLDSLEDVLRRGNGRVRLVALTAASNVTVKPVLPAASVVTLVAPMKRRPSPKLEASNAMLSKNSSLYVLLGLLLSVPVMVMLLPVLSMAVSTGKFCRLLSPASASPVSLGVGPFPFKSMPSLPLE